MNRETVRLCKENKTAVGYQSVIGFSEIKVVIIKSDIFDICGTDCVKVEGVSGCVDISHLFLIAE